jgi:integrase
MAKNELNFSQERIKALTLPEQGQRHEIYDTQVPGLMLRVYSSGKKIFYYYRWIKGAGKPERITLGQYPAIKVEQVRGKASEYNALVEKKENPNDPIKKQKTELTLMELFENFLICKRNKQGEHLAEKTKLEYNKIFNGYLSSWSNRKISKITSQEVIALHMKIGQNHRHMANRIKALLSSMYNFATKDKSISIKNPAAEIQNYPEDERDRFLHNDEIPEFFKALEQEPSLTMHHYFLVSLFTGVRKKDVLSMRWDQINLGRREWKIITKGNSRQTVTLSPEVCDILEDRQELPEKSEWVFPGNSKSGHLVEPKKAWKNLLDRAKLKDLRIHDLRRTLGSWQAINGSSLQVIGKSLNHKSLKSTAIYARVDLDPVRESVNRATAAIVNASQKKQSNLEL